MKNIDALKAKMFPYELPEDTLEFLLDEQGLEPSDDYKKDYNRTSLLQAVIEALHMLVTLSKEKDNGSEIQYDVANIWLLINRYKNELRPENKRGTNRDMTHIW